MLFLANTCFELELENPSLSLETLLSSHPHFLQLQFLPVLFAKPGDHVLVSEYPSSSYVREMESQGFTLPEFVLFKELKTYDEVVLWGQTHNTAKLFPSLPMPPLSSILELSSKFFAHALSPLPSSRLLHNEQDLAAFSEGIIKTAHGFSGRGNIPTSQKERLRKLPFPLLGEPFKERLFDFSTHWEIQHHELHFIGWTAGKYTTFGSYIGNRADNSSNRFVEEQKAFMETKKKALLQTGYFGPLSVDAMVYEEQGEKLQPMIEINPRRTMGSLTWHLCQKLGCSSLEIRYEKKGGQLGLLPNEKKFSKQLTYEIYR
jgi:hypothetical protein